MALAYYPNRLAQYTCFARLFQKRGSLAQSTQSKLTNFENLKALKQNHMGSQLVHCHGVFDVLHAGHLAYFESAKKYGDILIVTLTTDEFVNKGAGRPYFNSSVRANMLAALEIIDYVAISPFPTAVQVIEAIQPHFYVKGPDYQDKSKDHTGGIHDEEKAVNHGGGRLVFTQDAVFSSSTLINQFFQPWNERQERVIRAVQEIGGLETIDQILGQIGRQKVCVMGEPIVDTYVFCEPESISSKSPSISARFLYEENYAGGSLAIANHLCDLTEEVTLTVTRGTENYVTDLLKNKLDSRIHLIAKEIPQTQTPRKTRYISREKAQRMFELTHLGADQWYHHSATEFCQLIKKVNAAHDVTILADFGHGLFEREVLEATSDFQGFIGLNVQTNSSNFGFNPFSKFKKFNYLSVDTREVRVAYHDRFTEPLDLVKRLSREISPFQGACSMTLGSDGSYYFPSQNYQDFYSPAFTDVVIDATGAGDAYFAITSLLVKVNCPSILVPFLGNIYAGLKTKIIGNKAAVTKSQFIKAITAVLK